MESEHLIKYVFTATDELLNKKGDSLLSWRRYLRKRDMYPSHKLIKIELEPDNKVIFYLFPQAWYASNDQDEHPDKVTHVSSKYRLVREKLPEQDFVQCAVYTCPLPLPLDTALVHREFLDDLADETCKECYFELSDTSVTFHFYQYVAMSSINTFYNNLCSNFLGKRYLQYSQFVQLVNKSLELLAEARKEHKDEDKGKEYKHLLALCKTLPMAQLLTVLLVTLPGEREAGLKEAFKQVKMSLLMTGVKLDHILIQLIRSTAGKRLFLDIFACLGADQSMLRLVAMLMHGLLLSDDDDRADCFDIVFFKTQADSIFTPPLLSTHLVTSPPSFKFSTKKE